MGRINAFPEDYVATETICVKTAYNYLHSRRVPQLTNRYLFYAKRHKFTKQRPTKRQNGLSIELRPQHIENRQELGNYELDTIKSCRGSKACLLNLIERKTRLIQLRKMRDCSTASTRRALNHIERYGQIIKGGTVTADNGSEFHDVSGIENSCLESGNRFTAYFTHSYCS
jgi:IS30 family transposase